MEPWIVVGWETGISEKNQREFTRVYVERGISQDVTGFGKETNRIFFYNEYVKYEPAIGDLIVPVEGRYGVDQIIKFGNVNA